MNHLIFDTETTGFYNPKLSATHQGQARVIQLAAVKLDSELNEIESLNVLIKPELWYIMSDGAYQAHGISLDKCKKEGIEQKEAFSKFLKLSSDCDALIAHNLNFDLNMFKIEATNANVVYGSETRFNWHYCTMELMTPICRLPHKRNNAFGQTYKWPKLIEALTFIGKPFVGREHDGLSDARACAEIYRYLIKQGIIKLPAQPIAEVKLA